MAPAPTACWKSTAFEAAKSSPSASRRDRRYKGGRQVAPDNRRYCERKEPLGPAPCRPSGGRISSGRCTSVSELTAAAAADEGLGKKTFGFWDAAARRTSITYNLTLCYRSPDCTALYHGLELESPLPGGNGYSSQNKDLEHISENQATGRVQPTGKPVFPSVSDVQCEVQLVESGGGLVKPRGVSETLLCSLWIHLQ
ncbi:uncharacterized protein LOC119062518 isoform X11 [Artibeus jamaicensis]|uniref:uncharacterized protein LOC119062518 isoform X11 n=1 Tax=Artibeus jamaicensis TaxID=9417 RepID=UPI00235B2941|nr:uncharacterized protein LOC119062518 isoform X11 [Artibeus jamaicensis]